jgi:hypothetical protein
LRLLISSIIAYVKEATKGSPLLGSSTPFLRQLQLHIGSYFLVTNQRRDRYIIDVDGIES